HSYFCESFFVKYANFQKKFAYFLIFLEKYFSCVIIIYIDFYFLFYFLAVRLKGIGKWQQKW
ncbi:MAG: hypothetical protein ACRCW1_01035, partial [Anaerotignaceae bacterium]